ncbi:hypothetical protein CVD28_00425 [Bacillus sp. M6-12]|uniref:hypothetical protein n=1 Tax=Bacillus sp. M6-12 TaxID=2054166 RepID=UPI000C794FA6|nr:hypothetical protein [Bacillus sp. M6-12]PLS18900.1 hypothetical protein CVD28_00425 [Bacillus sp. M6-12]
MLTKEIRAFGRALTIGCDGKCEKAFGLNGRPSVQLSDDEDDICWLADDEVGIAPTTGKTVITSEGGDMKPHPAFSGDKLNKWCYRECERCASAEIGEELKVKDFSVRRYNMPSKHGVEQ